MGTKISFKTGEAKLLTLTIMSNGLPLDVSDSKFVFGVKKKKSDIEYLIKKTTSDFDTTQAEQGKISCFLDDTDLSLSEGVYVGELKIEFPDGSIDKSDDFTIEILSALTTD